MKIQGFDPRFIEKITTVGIEPPSTLKSTSLNYWAILALSARAGWTLDYIKQLHILKRMKIQGFEPRFIEKITTVGIEPHNTMISTSLNHLAILSLSVRTGITPYYIEPLHILKRMKIQGFDPRFIEKITTVGIEPPSTLKSTSLNYWAILALSARESWTIDYIKPLHIIKRMKIQGFEPRFIEKITTVGIETFLFTLINVW